MQNREERVKTSLPVDLGFGKGVTKDISMSGVFFETDADCRPGSEIDMTITMDGPHGPLLLRCTGQILRVELKGGKRGIAAKLSDVRLKEV